MELWLPTQHQPAEEPLSVPQSLWLPPRETWLIDPNKEKLETPLDSLGLVDIYQTIALVKSKVDPNYIWPAISINPHHYQWAESLYGRDPDPLWGVIPSIFRNLPTRKGHLPRYMENWIHKITLEPPVPDAEVMYYSVEAWTAAYGLFTWVKESTLAERRAKRWLKGVEDGSTRPKDGDETSIYEWLTHEKARLERGREYSLKKLDGVPEEFRLVDEHTTPVDIAGKVGRLALKKSHQLKRASQLIHAA